MDLIDLLSKVFTMLVAAGAVAAMLKKPIDQTLKRLENIEKSTIENTVQIKEISNNQVRATLNSSMQKIEIKQELSAKITDSELIELEGQFIDYKSKGGNGHMEARYRGLMNKVGKYGL